MYMKSKLDYHVYVLTVAWYTAKIYTIKYVQVCS